MACFVRLDLLSSHTDELPRQTFEKTQAQNVDVPFPIEKFPYKLLFSKEFPFHQDARSIDEKIMDDVKYFINRHLNSDDPYFNDEKDICEFPLKSMLPFVHDAADLNELRKVVKKEFAVNAQDCIEHKLLEESDDYDQSDYENDDDDGTNQQCVPNQQMPNEEDDESWD